MTHNTVKLESKAVYLFVRKTSYDDDSRNGVEEREDANSEHKLLQLVSFGSSAFHDSPHLKEKPPKQGKTSTTINQSDAVTKGEKS